MFEIPLLHPIHTLDDRELLPAGINLTEDTVREVIASNNSPVARSISLMRFEPVKNDISQFFANPPYNTIFANQDDIEDVLNVMIQLSLPIPVLEALDYFREHDFHTYRHSLMVFALSTLLARRLVPDYYEVLLHAKDGPSHDLGKICVPLEILMKHEPLTREERGILFQHSVAGYVMLCYYTKDPANFSAKVARDHHELRDGSGYMRGVKLHDPMVEIVAVSDIYDALLSSRPYRPVSFDNRTALEEVIAMAQRDQISWDVVQGLVSLNRKDKPDHRAAKVSLEKRGMPPADNAYGKSTDN